MYVYVYICIYIYIYIWEGEPEGKDHISPAVNNGQNRLEALGFIFLKGVISGDAVICISCISPHTKSDPRFF